MSEERNDKRYHFLGGLLAALVFFITFNYFVDFKLVFKGSIKDLLVSATTISAIGVGFLATTKAIIISIRSSKAIRWLKDGGHYNSLISYSMNAIHWCIAFAIYSSLCLFLNYNNPSKLHFYIIVLWIFFATTAFLSSYRVIKLFSTILMKETEE